MRPSMWVDPFFNFGMSWGLGSYFGWGYPYYNYGFPYYTGFYGGYYDNYYGCYSNSYNYGQSYYYNSYDYNSQYYYGHRPSRGRSYQTIGGSSSTPKTFGDMYESNNYASIGNKSNISSPRSNANRLSSKNAKVNTAGKSRTSEISTPKRKITNSDTKSPYSRLNKQDSRSFSIF